MSKSALTQGVYGSDTNNHVIFEKQSYERKKKLGNREAASHRGDDSGSFGSDTRGYLRAKKSLPPKPTRSIPPIPEDNFAKAREDVRRRYQTFSEFLRTMEA